MNKSLEQKFWERTQRRGGDECWPWTGETNNMGYGRIAFGSTKNRRRVFAHHAALVIHGTPITGIVMHTCDNPRCVNPSHLTQGTQADNLADMRAKRRHNYGERNGMAKLTNQEVVEMRALLASDLSQQEIADRFRVSKQVVKDVKRGRRWAQVV